MQLEEYKMNNGLVFLPVEGYNGDEDFQVIYKLIKELLAPEDIAYTVDSMCIDGSFTKEGIIIRICSESAYDACCFTYNAGKLDEAAILKAKTWIGQVVDTLVERIPR